jgi:hypothetical protein
MTTNNQSGSAASVLLIVLLTTALVAVTGFGWWAYQQRQDYKNRFDQKVAEEVVKAKADQKTQLEKEFAEKEKSPNKTFQSSATFGTVTFNYPKTWSGYVEQSNNNQPINGYFFPDIVPAIDAGGSTPTAFALRIELTSEDYAQAVKQFDSQIEQGQVKAVAYVPPKMAGVTNAQTGTRFDGELEEGIRGSMVVIKVRDKTLKIYTQSTQYLTDFNDTVLSSLTFVP